ncbi:MAG: DUF4230 domain-containing protein [Pacificimonas sp.]
MKTVLKLLLGIIVGAGALFAWQTMSPPPEDDPDIASIAAASLEAVRAENRLNVFAGRFTVAVTSRAERFGFAAEKTMIVPATVRYQVDYAKLMADDLNWDPSTGTLTVDLPPVEISEPEVDLKAVRDYGDGTVLLTLGDAEARLDRANRAKVREAVMREAEAPVMREMARAAARDAVVRGFRLPLEAAGVPARVEVRFADEAGSGS